MLPAISATIRTARSFSSGGYLLEVFPDMTPTLPRIGVSGHAGAVQFADLESGLTAESNTSRQRATVGPQAPVAEGQMRSLLTLVPHVGGRSLTVQRLLPSWSWWRPALSRGKADNGKWLRDPGRD